MLRTNRRRPTLYTLHCLVDSASTIIRLVLEDVALPHRVVMHDDDRGALDSPSYRALNPMGLIPALETPDGPLFETGAILLWLADRHGGIAPAAEAPDRAAFLSWHFHVANTLHPAAMRLVYPGRSGGEGCAAAVGAQARADLAASFGHLERLVATGAGWLSPRGALGLTYYIAVLFRWACHFPADPENALDPAPYPALRALLADAEARPAARRVGLAEGLGPAPFSALSA